MKLKPLKVWEKAFVIAWQQRLLRPFQVFLRVLFVVLDREIIKDWNEVHDLITVFIDEVLKSLVSETRKTCSVVHGGIAAHTQLTLRASDKHLEHN